MQLLLLHNWGESWVVRLEGKASELSFGDGWELGSPINTLMELNDLLGVVGIQEDLLCCNLGRCVFL